MTTEKRFNEILAALNNNDWMMVDNHSSNGEWIQCSAVVVLNRGDIGQFINGCRYQSINAIMVYADGIPHLSQASIGPVVMGNDFDSCNESCVFDGGQIYMVHFKDGTRIYPKQFAK